jgi:very-short-patch-repair endonuclease
VSESPELDADHQRVIEQINIWRRQLIDLARSNRLLYFHHTRTSTLEILDSPERLAAVVAGLVSGTAWRFFSPSEEDEEGRDDTGNAAVKRLLLAPTGREGSRLPESNELVTSKDSPRELLKTLRTLDRRATQEFMDRGIWVLYLAIGVLRWKDPDFPEEAESPLLLLPVQLHRDSPREPYELKRSEEDVVLNPALAVKLAEFGVELPTVEEDELDFLGSLGEIERAVANQEGWQVQRRLLLSPFSFHKEVMYRDIERNEDAVADSPLVQALAIGSAQGCALDFEVVPEDLLDEKVIPEETVTILDADATQMQCIAAASTGRSFVMDGPPGTGKSQTIANIIAELMAKGKTILFVSEKAAALEVVQKRLRSAGLGDYCLELHSHKATRKEVAQQLGRALERHPAVPPAMTEMELAQLRQRRQQLSERAVAMNEVRQPLGQSLYDVIGRISQLDTLPQAPPPTELGSWLSADSLSAILSAAGEISRAWGPVTRGADFVWRDLVDVSLNATRAQRTKAQLEAAAGSLEKLGRVCQDAANLHLLRSPTDFSMGEALARVLRHLEKRPGSISAEWLSRHDFAAIEALVQDRRQLALSYGRAEKVLLELVGARWPEIGESVQTVVSSSILALHELEPAFDVPDDVPLASLESIRQGIAEAEVLIETVKSDIARIAAPFGIGFTQVSLEWTAEMAELALLSGAPVRPESTWLSPANIAAVEEAARTLERLCALFNERRAQLSDVFTDEVLTLDLAGLCQRFETSHRGLGKLRAGYREDLRVVARVVRAGKTKVAVDGLPLALEWQRIAMELRAAESRHAVLLGSFYYRSSATDFDTLRRALTNARRAIEIGGGSFNTEAMSRQLARGGSPDAQLVPIAGRLKTLIDGWRARAVSVLGSHLGMIYTANLETAAQWCGGALSAVTELVRVSHEVGSLATRPITLGELKSCADARAEIAAAGGRLRQAEESDRRVLGSAYQVLETNWDLLDSSVDWTAQLRQLIGDPLTTASAQRLTSVDPNAQELDTALNDWHRSREVVVSNFLDQRAGEVRTDLDTTFEDAQELLTHLVASLSDIDEWVEFDKASRALAELRVGGVIEFCEKIRVMASEVPSVVERACLERWADTIIDEDQGRLGQLRADQLDPLVAEFRDLDAKLIDRAAHKTIVACNEHRPRTTVGAAGIIKREAEKQRRHMPVRRLLEETAEVAQLLKPCFMMSPLTVSQFLPPSLGFDAVIFDEASQVRPCDAINCIYRGKQLVIAGDDKQLPPTSFWEAMSVDDGDEWEEDQFEDFESIINLGKGSGGLRELPLRWHYRSQHEDLIAFSNFSFYEGRLITFPGSTAEAGDLGVKLYYVPDGVYRRGTARDNPKEAEVVVDRVIHWAKHSLDNPSAAVTLGVVAFSEAQADGIESALDRRRRSLPELDAYFGEDRLDGFFVKNLENVQGDERDVMIFSVGYGRDEAGKLTMNFGPLNREGGERRLNVAITRARQRVELVTSVTGTEPEFAASLNERVHHFQRYLDYAARGPVALAIDVGEDGLDAESPFEEEVIRTIRSWGYEVKPQVGTAGYRVDIGVWHPSLAGRFAIGIECDGRMYHSSRVARDRDRLRQEVLERLGWRIYRVWGTAWYRHRREEEERLRAAIEEAVAGGVLSIRTRTRASSDNRRDETFELVPLDVAPSWSVPYVVAVPQQPRSRVEMHTPEALRDLQRMILEVVEVEGPIEDELLLRRIREAWGVGRSGHRIRENFDYAVRILVQRQAVTRFESSFTCAHAGQLRVVRVVGDDDAGLRSVAQVSQLELMTAIRNLVEDAHRVSRDELTREVSRLFGWLRRGPDIAPALDQAVERLIQNDTLIEDEGFLKLR